MKQHPWLAEIVQTGSEPERTRRLIGAGREVNGVPMRIVEMCGEPGDVFIAHLHLFHCAAPNTRATPRLMLGKGIFERASANQHARDEADL